MTQSAIDKIAPEDLPDAGVAYGYLAKAYCNRVLPLDVYKSNAGFYIGTYSEDGPCSRESVEYFRTETAAREALATTQWTQRHEP